MLFGLFDKLIFCANFFFKKFKKSWVFTVKNILPIIEKEVSVHVM